MSATLIRQLIFFALVGAAATLTHYLVALGAHEAAGINLYLANPLGYASAVSVSYLGHGWLTFRVPLTGANLGRFLPASLATFAFSEALLWALEQFAPQAHRLTLAAVALSVPVVSFVLNKYWVYRAPRRAH